LIEGWLIDCYPSKKEGRSDPEGGMTFWIKRASDGKSVRIKDTTWRFRVYAAGAACDDPNYLLTRLRPTGLVRSVRVVEKRADIYAKEKEPVLELELNTGDGARKLGETLEGIFKNPSAFSLYNIDILPEQQYFYDKDLFPLAYVRAEVDDNSNIIGWELLDSISSLEYQSPKLKCVRLSLGLSDLVPTFNSHLRSVGISSLSSEEEGADGSFVLDGKNESELIEEAVREIKRLDPDLIVTRNGDSFGFPYLSAKAREFSVSLEGLNRDPDAGEFAHNRADAKTYFSYGKIMYRPATQRLYGRLHLDEENTFVYDQCRLEGLYEVSRLCRIPFHTSMRASIGKCLSSLQFYYASKKDILIPWKPKIAEDFKNGYELLLADRGGLVLEPLRGVFDRVCELDFASLYPSIIRMYNISVETVNCRCCSGLELTEEDQEDIKRDPSRNSLREMGLHICTAERGIVPESLEYPLDKRFEYKKLRDATPDERVKRIFNERAGSLKWILVCCFGYLSYRNAKFGKIDSHIAVCAFARKTLLEAMQTAELRGYRVIHGIVDSLWVRKRDADRKHYEELRRDRECDRIPNPPRRDLQMDSFPSEQDIAPKPGSQQVLWLLRGIKRDKDEGNRTAQARHSKLFQRVPRGNPARAFHLRHARASERESERTGRRNLPQIRGRA
jgi:DNA polymerase I